MSKEEEALYYKVAKGATVTELEKEVNDLVEKGYIPKGGVIFKSSPVSTYYMQAMYREEGKQVILG